MFSQVKKKKKWKCIRKDKRISKRDENPSQERWNSVKLEEIENVVEWKPIELNKRKKEPARLKTWKGGLGKN